MSESGDQVIKIEQELSDDQSIGCEQTLNTCAQRLPLGPQSFNSNQSGQTTQGIDGIIIETNNEQDVNSGQIARVGSAAAERNRLYRERHREKINQRRRDIRNRKKNSHESISDMQNTQEIEEITHATSNNQQSSKSHTQRQQRYYESHKEEINKRKRDSRLKPNVPQFIPLTAAERNRNYRQRNKQTINERRRDSRLLRQNANEMNEQQQKFNISEFIHPTIPTTPVPEAIQCQYESNIGLKQSSSASSPVSTPLRTQYQYDFDEDSQNLSFQNYPSPEEDHEIFGAFIASELRGLGNNYQLIRSVKKKIQLTILEAYETYDAQNFKHTSTRTRIVPLQQPHVPLQHPHVRLQQPHVPSQPHVPLEESHVPLQQPHVPSQLPHVPSQQPHPPPALPDEPTIKIELIDDDD